MSVFFGDSQLGLNPGGNVADISASLLTAAASCTMALADANFGRVQAILKQRQKIKLRALEHGRLQYQKQAA